jgi:H+/gluconate symporter and related permeases
MQYTPKELEMEAESRCVGAEGRGGGIMRAAKAIPFPVALLALTVLLGLASGMDDGKLSAALNRGFGLNIGYFALLLLSSFALAEALAALGGVALGKLGPIIAPFAGAGMVCCDTAYATLSPLAGRYKKQVAVGAYAGFKLLLPAGPLIIGSSLAASTGSPAFLALGIGLTAVATVAGLLCLRIMRSRNRASPAEAGVRPSLAGQQEERPSESPRLMRGLLPFGLLAVLIIVGLSVDLSALPVVKFFCAPLGALLLAALLACLLAPREKLAQIGQSALSRTASLIFVIGSATSLGSMLGSLAPLGSLAAALSPGDADLALCGICFALAAVFKIINGSSMATFAAVPPLVAPLVSATSLDPTLATYSLCLGALVAVLPNDSFFWITQPAGKGAGGAKPDFTMTWVSLSQGVLGFAALAIYVLVAR